MPKAIENIVSHFKQKGKDFKIYARKGEEVTIIEQRDNVLIIKGKREKFPCLKSKIK